MTKALFERVPHELWLSILLRLDPEEWVSIAETNKKLAGTVASPSLWRAVAARLYAAGLSAAVDDHLQNNRFLTAVQAAKHCLDTTRSQVMSLAAGGESFTSASAAVRPASLSKYLHAAQDVTMLEERLDVRLPASARRVMSVVAAFEVLGMELFSPQRALRRTIDFRREIADESHEFPVTTDPRSWFTQTMVVVGADPDQSYLLLVETARDARLPFEQLLLGPIYCSYDNIRVLPGDLSTVVGLMVSDEPEDCGEWFDQHITDALL